MTKWNPTKFNPAIGEKILLLLADEGLGVNAACARVGIARRTVRDWATTIPEFAAQLAEARQQSYEFWADEILEIGDKLTAESSMAEVNAARLQVDSRKWLLSKLKPDRYGDRVELTGKDGRDLIPATPEAAVPRLMQVLAILLPGVANSELHALASAMASKLTTALPAPDPDDEEPGPANGGIKH